MPARRYTAIIADDHAIVREGLRDALERPGFIEEEGIEVVAEAEDGLQAIAELRRHRPDLLLLDVSMPMAGGVEVLAETRRWSPDTRVVVLTGITAVGLVSSLAEAGVDGLFSKGAPLKSLYETLPSILRGTRHIAPRFTELLENAPEAPALTDRERQTLNFILRGMSNKEMAATLGISPKTVDKHRTALMGKLGVNSVAQLMALALKEGLIDPAREL